ncbi:MAG: hypothetical protein SWE60_11415 [Thermodesulfobacteriota bacterium]|nr:hypothetical protein [Thermodesulfobacteriota bacterium]
MSMRLQIVPGLVLFFVFALMLAPHSPFAEPATCLEAAGKAEAVVKKAAEAGQGAMDAVERARAEGTLEAAREAKEAADTAREAAEEAREVASHARSMGCLEAADRAEGAAKEADKSANKAEEGVEKIIKLLEGLKPAFLDPGTSEAERYQQEKEVSPSQ